MRLGIVSDSHDHATNTLAGIEMLRSLDVERVLHCGDICSANIVKLFADWPTDFVFGNCDHLQTELAAAITAAGQTCHGMFGDLEIAGKRIALLHSHDHRKFREVTTNGEWDLVCYGHTHVARQEHVGDTLVLNPGALYRANPHSIAIVELPQLAATIVTL